jgi:hypothetical protein
MDAHAEDRGCYRCGCHYGLPGAAAPDEIAYHGYPADGPGGRLVVIEAPAGCLSAPPVPASSSSRPRFARLPCAALQVMNPSAVLIGQVPTLKREWSSPISRQQIVQL